ASLPPLPRSQSHNPFLLRCCPFPATKECCPAPALDQGQSRAAHAAPSTPCSHNSTRSTSRSPAYHSPAASLRLRQSPGTNSASSKSASRPAQAHSISNAVSRSAIPQANLFATVLFVRCALPRPSRPFPPPHPPPQSPAHFQSLPVVPPLECSRG